MGTEQAVAAEGLGKRFGPVRALAGVDLAVPASGVLGLLGPNGAGKTTLVRILATLLRPDQGRARVCGLDVTRQPDQVRRLVGLSGQYAAVDAFLTGRENLRMVGRLAGLGRTAARRRADELLERFDLGEAAGRVARTYSGGMRRRLDVAASLVARPAVVFLDEPTTGLDPRGRVGLWRLLGELTSQGASVLLTTQYLEEADRHGWPRRWPGSAPAPRQSTAPWAGWSSPWPTAPACCPRWPPAWPPAACAWPTWRCAGRPWTTCSWPSRASPPAPTPRPTPTVRTPAARARPPERSTPMSATTTAQPPMAAAPTGGLARRLANTFTITGRNLHRLVRVPTLIAFATVQPVMFVLLFNYTYGGAIHPPGVTRYIDYILPGTYVLAIAFGASQTGVAVADDLGSGMIDRFRALPMARSAVLAGRALADAVRNLFVLGLMTGVGAAIGFRFHAGAGAALAAVGLAVLVGLAFSWLNALFGLLVRDAESAGLAGLLGVIPLLFASSTFVPVATMPGWLQAFAKANPVTVVVDALRALCLSSPTATHVWQALAWIAALLAISVPAAVARYRHTTAT